MRLLTEVLKIICTGRLSPISPEPGCEDAHPENLNQRNTAQSREDFNSSSRTHIQWFQKSHPRNESMWGRQDSEGKKTAEFPKPVFTQKAQASAIPRKRLDEQSKRPDPENRPTISDL